MCAYIGRTNYSAALAAIVTQGLFTKPQAGIIGTVFFFCYGGGQIINGFLGDRFSPFGMVAGGLTLSAAANLMMSFSDSYVIMSVIWGINGIAQSMLWSPILRIFSTVIHEDLRQKACLNVCVTVPAGTVAAYLISTLVIKYSVWQNIFRIASAVLFVTAIIFLAVYSSIKKHFTHEEIIAPPVITKDGKNASMKLLPVMFTSGLVLAMLPTMLHGALKEGISTWVPTMLTETYTVSASFSVFISVVMPVFNVFGAYFISPFYNKLFKRNEILSATFCILISCLPLTVLLFIGKIPVLVGIVLLAVTTTMMHAFNYMLITLAPVRFAPFGKTSTVTGLMNASAYAGCALSAYGFGWISDAVGWQKTVMFWLGIAAVIIISCLVCMKPWRRFTNSLDEAAREAKQNECV